MATMNDVHLGWFEQYVYHRICMHHLASNFMTRFKDKIFNKFLCRAALATKVEKFNKHMDTIWRINLEAQRWLEAIPLEKWALSHDGGRRYGIMTINISEIFNSVLKGAHSLLVIAFVQLTFFWLNSYFVARREQGANKWASDEQYTAYVDAKIKARVRGPLPFTAIRMQPIRGRGGGRGCGRDAERGGGRSTHEKILPPSTSFAPFAPKTSTPPETSTPSSSTTPHVILVIP